MRVRDVFAMAKIRIKNIAVNRDTAALFGFLNMAVSDLYNRFNLSIKSETILTNPDVALYEVRAEDVLMLLGLFDPRGIELKQTDVIGGVQYDYKLVNYKSFVVRKPQNGYLFAVYKASSVPLVDEDDLVQLPDSMLEALLTYIVYLSFTTINRDNMNEAAMYYQQYMNACNVLENQGYRIPLDTERINMALKGFV